MNLNIGISCFNDAEIVSIINNQETAICDITGIEQPVYNTSNADCDFSIENYMIGILDIYTPMSELPKDFPEKSLQYIEEVLFEKWAIFNVNKEYIKKIIIELCKSEYKEDAAIFNEKVGMIRLCDLDYLERNSLVKGSSWKKFVSSIKNINRFHSNHINLELLETLVNNERLQLIISKDQKEFYRGRICNGNKFSEEEMGPPKPEYVTAGRANSEGIRCFYLASDQTTVLHEIRARDLDYISIAEFKAKRKLRVVDLSVLDKISPFSDDTYDYEWYAINMSLLKMISEEISKPLRRHDSTLDYLPAQYIVDFIKSLGFDGVCYKSTLNKDGLNYAFFDYKKFRCINVELYYINSLSYEKEVVC